MFKVGDSALCTQMIKRLDGRSIVQPGERVKITGVYQGKNFTIVDIQPYSGAMPIRDICCDASGPLKV